MTPKTRKWLHGLGAAFIGGGAGAVTGGTSSMIVAPDKFNLQEGMGKTFQLMALSFLFGAVTHTAAYFKQAPLPEPGDTEPPFPK